MPNDFDIACMRRALALAAQGEGHVEPNPMVGCVITRDGAVLSEGWHAQFGGPHAEVAALNNLPPHLSAKGATFFVTLEPCCHFGKTPPCADAIIAAGAARVVVAMRDPFPKVAGGGIAKLQAANIPVDVGLLEADARALLAPYLMLVEQQRPWTIAKWAMTLDGKIATASGDSQWISCEASRAIVHKLRRRVDAIVVGRNTADRDNPQLTARPSGARVPLRVVVDSTAKLALHSNLVTTAREVPTLIAVGPAADSERIHALEALGCQVHHDPANDRNARLVNLWRHLGERRLTNVLVEGGAQLLGSLLDAQLIDEVHTFIAPKLIGGAQAATPIGGSGRDTIAAAFTLHSQKSESIGTDLYISGRIQL